MLISRPETSPSGPGLTNGTPQPLGTADPGSGLDASRGDHVHQMPTAGDVGADPAGTAASAASAAQAAATAASNAYTDAAILAATLPSGRARIASVTSIPNLTSVTLSTLDPTALPPVALAQGDKVLVLNQASPDGILLPSDAYCGLYDVGAVVAGVAPLTRNSSYNTAGEICGASWFVTDGTYSNDFWACTNDPAATTLDVDSLFFVQIAGALSNNAAQPLGVAAAGTSHDVSRADHVHAMPSASDVGAISTSDRTNTAPQALGLAATSGTSTNVARLDHVHPFPTASDVGAIPTTAITNTAPQALGAAASSGSSTDVARLDHVHPRPSIPVPLLSGVVSTVLTADTVAGYGYVDPTGLASLTLAAVGQVVAGVTGTLDLYDLTAASVVATMTWTETAPTRKTVSVTVPVSARLYELRVRKSGGGASDYALFSSVSLIGS